VEIKVSSGNLIFVVKCSLSFYWLLSPFSYYLLLSDKNILLNRCTYHPWIRYWVLIKYGSSSIYVTICFLSTTTECYLVITVHCSANQEVHWRKKKKDWQKWQITSAEVPVRRRNKKKDYLLSIGRVLGSQNNLVGLACTWVIQALLRRRFCTWLVCLLGLGSVAKSHWFWDILKL
jgi:hypothetical protein